MIRIKNGTLFSFYKNNIEAQIWPEFTGSCNKNQCNRNHNPHLLNKTEEVFKITNITFWTLMVSKSFSIVHFLKINPTILGRFLLKVNEKIQILTRPHVFHMTNTSWKVFCSRHRSIIHTNHITIQWNIMRNEA